MLELTKNDKTSTNAHIEAILLRKIMCINLWNLETHLILSLDIFKDIKKMIMIICIIIFINIYNFIYKYIYFVFNYYTKYIK